MSDSLWVSFPRADAAEFSHLELSIDSLNSGVPTLLELWKGRQLVARRMGPGRGSWTMTFPGLTPGDYRVILTRDDNANGRWDGGDYYRRQFPEPRTVHPIPNLRANWELEHHLRGVWTEDNTPGGEN